MNKRKFIKALAVTPVVTTLDAGAEVARTSYDCTADPDSWVKDVDGQIRGLTASCMTSITQGANSSLIG